MLGMYIICNSFAGLLIFFVVVYLNTNFRLNGSGESCVRELKNFSSFLEMNLKNKGIVILVKQKKTIEQVHYST